MNLSKITQAIRGFFRKADLDEAMSNTQQQLVSATLPAISEAVKMEERIDFSKNVTGIELKKMVMQNAANASRNGSLFKNYEIIAADMVAFIDILRDEAQKFFGDITDKDSIDYARLQIVALANNVEAVSTFIRKSIRYIVMEEVATVTKTPINKLLSNAQINFIKNKANRLEFYNAINIITRIKARDIPKILRKIPDAKPEADGALGGQYNQRVVDPTGALNNFSLTSVVSYPVYLVMMKVVDYQYNKFKLAEEELNALRIELDWLNSAISNGQGDAALAKQAETAQERIDKLEAENANFVQKAMSSNYD